VPNARVPVHSFPRGNEGDLHVLIDGEKTEVKREDIVEEILSIELEMFLSVPTERRSACQDHPDSFKLHRRAQFCAWSDRTLASYFSDLREAKAQGRNLMTHKYARMQGLIPEAHGGGSEGARIIDDIVRIHYGWQEELFRKYPVFMSGARPLGSGEDSDRATSFETYLRGELDSYSKPTLSHLQADILSLRDKGLNMSEVVYDFLVKRLGYPSLAEAERTLAERRRG
jgi:Protein of unknown function (DUF4125)